MLEIILVAIAWSRGWKWRAFIPVFIAWALAFILGASIGEDAIVPVVFVAICEIVTLIVMIAKSPANEKQISKIEPEPIKLEVIEPETINVIEKEQHI